MANSKLARFIKAHPVIEIRGNPYSITLREKTEDGNGALSRMDEYEIEIGHGGKLKYSDDCILENLVHEVLEILMYLYHNVVWRRECADTSISHFFFDHHEFTNIARDLSITLKNYGILGV